MYWRSYRAAGKFNRSSVYYPTCCIPVISTVCPIRVPSELVAGSMSCVSQCAGTICVYPFHNYFIHIMKQRNRFVMIGLAIIIIIAGSLDAGAQFRRRDIYDSFYSAADRHRLRTLIIQWVSTHKSDPIQQHISVIGPLPVGVHCKTATFLTWHRQYIEQLETWLMGQQDGPKFVPLPKWNPTTQIPGEFFNDAVPPGSAVVTGYLALTNQNPNIGGGYNFNRFLNPATICDYVAGVQQRYCMGVPGVVNTFGTALDNFARALELEHNPVHTRIGGVMGFDPSPAAAIFFLWHGYVDDLYQHYLCACTNDYPDKDLYIMDNDGDIGAEPNTTTPIYYQSPEIWVRQNPDVQAGGRYSLEDNPNRHQNAEYKASGYNYVYVRVRNKGCQATVANEVRLRLYWSKAQTAGWSWPGDWTNTPPQSPKRGDEITSPGLPLWVPPLQPGQTWTAEIPWQAPNPDEYDPNDSYHFCLLARLESASDPMAVAEGSDVNANTSSNNNIAWKNISVRNDDPFNIGERKAQPWNTVHVRPTRPDVHDIRILFDYPANNGVHAMIDLRGKLYDEWVKYGRRGYGVTEVGKPYLRVDMPGAYIEGLPPSDEPHTLGVQPYVEYGKGYAGAIRNYGDRVNFNVQQYENYGKIGVYKLVGGNNYEIRLNQITRSDCKELISKISVREASCPDATDAAITLESSDEYEYFWSNGGRTRSLENVVPGTYWVVVRNSNNCIQREEIVVADRSALTASITAEAPRCHYSNGKVDISVTGGKAPYSYQWYRNDTPLDDAKEKTLEDIDYGIYDVIITDANGCQATRRINLVDDFMQIGLSYEVTDASSENAADGAIDLTVLDGMGPYSFTWSNGSTKEDLHKLAPGDYSVMVVDHMGCVASGTVTVGVALNKNRLSDAASSDLRIIAVVPNPVQDLAEVQYMLRYQTNVKAEVYDELGKLVATYDQGVKSPGTGSMWVPTSGLPSGRYQCRLVYRGGVSAIPFVVVR